MISLMFVDYSQRKKWGDSAEEMEDEYDKGNYYIPQTYNNIGYLIYMDLVRCKIHER